MSDAFYDVVIIGTELSGLIAGALLAKKGYRVLVVGHGQRSNRYVHEGFSFQRRPWLFSGFETSAPVKRVFSDLGLSLEMHNRPKPFDPFYQIVLPGRRIDVAAKEALFERELRREFGGEVERIQGFYRAVREQNERIARVLEHNAIMPPDGFFESRAYRKLMEEALNPPITDPLATLGPRHPFLPFVLAPLAFSSGCQLEPYSPVQLTRLATHLGRGLFHIEGGIDTLKSIFIERVKQNCGDYRDAIQIDRFAMRRGKVREVVIRDRREVIGCEAVICNMDIKRFFNLIPEEDQKERYHLGIHELQPTHYLYTTNFAVRGEAVPEGMGRHVFHVPDPSRALEDDNLLLIQVDAAERTPAEGDTHVLSVTARIRARHVRPTLEWVEAVDARLVRQLATVVPFVHEHLVAQGSAWVTLDKRTRTHVVDPTVFVPILGSPLEDTLDITPIGCRTAYKNVLVAGDHLMSGLGFEGAFLGALNVLQLTSDLVSKKSLIG